MSSSCNLHPYVISDFVPAHVLFDSNNSVRTFRRTHQEAHATIPLRTIYLLQRALDRGHHLLQRTRLIPTSSVWQVPELAENSIQSRILAQEARAFIVDTRETRNLCIEEGRGHFQPRARTQ
jgi:hypothetical protein